MSSDPPHVSPLTPSLTLPSPAADETRRPLRRRLPRPETVFLLIGLGFTLFTKLHALRPHKPSHLLIAWVDVALPDFAFFAGTYLAIRLLYWRRPVPMAARAALLLGATILVWSMLNAGWLFATGVQLQPGVLGSLARAPRDFWPIVQTHIGRNLSHSLPGAIVLISALVWFCWRLARPPAVLPLATQHRRRAIVAAAITAVALLSRPLFQHWSNLGFSSQVLGFSSHWYAVASFGPNGRDAGPTTPRRELPSAGQRDLAAPDPLPDPLPNVVIVMLESVSFASSSLAGAGLDTTPTLLKLAGEGTHIVQTYVPVSHTTKAFWATLTGSTPDLQPDYAEAIPVPQPYESLASILRRIGYRSAFFEMSKGTFECAPGLFANLGFDWAWFRENLEDESAHVGYVGGDDVKLLGPAFEWVEEKPGPFLLTMITSIAHDPYEVPAWFGEPKPTRYENYLQCIRYTDHFVSQVCRKLDEHGLADNTILCVIGDHGESFRGDVPRGRWVPYEEVVRVPWLIRWPGHIEPGRRVEHRCSQLDVTPTLLNLIGFETERAGFDGRDALGPPDADRPIRFSGWFGRSPMGCFDGNLKYIYWPYQDTLYRYNLTTDPREESPVLIEDAQRDPIIDNLLNWKRDSQILFRATRYEDKILFDHWHVFSTGREAWAYYSP